METIISILAIGISAVSLIYSVVTHIRGAKREKKQATLDAFNILQEQVLDKLNQYRKSDIQRIATDIHSTEYKELSSLLARCEHFAVGVNTGIYDLKTVKRLARLYIVSVYEKMLPMVEKKRQISKVEKHYDDFEKLYLNL